MQNITLSYALELAHAACDRRGIIPARACARLAQLENGGLRVYSTDMDLWIRADVPAANVTTGGEERAALVPLDKLRAAIKTLPAGAVPSVTFEADAVTVGGGRGTYRIPTLPLADYPDLTAAEARDYVALIDREPLAKALALCLPAVSTEKTRYYLHGVYFEPVPKRPGELVAVATDGHRLAHALVPLFSEPAGAWQPSIWPVAFCKLVAKVLAGKFVPVRVKVLQGKTPNGTEAIALDFHGFTIGSKCIDGTFPDWRRVVPIGTAEHDVPLPVAETLEAVAAAVAVSEDRSKALSLSWSAGGVLLHHASTEGVDAKAYATRAPAATAYAIGVNGGYLTAALTALEKACGTRTVALRVGDYGAPMRLEPTDAEGFGYVLMPMRLGYGAAGRVEAAEQNKREAKTDEARAAAAEALRHAAE